MWVLSTVDPSPLLSSCGLGLLSAVPATTNGLLVGAGVRGFLHEKEIWMVVCFLISIEP